MENCTSDNNYLVDLYTVMNMMININNIYIIYILYVYSVYMKLN